MPRLRHHDGRRLQLQRRRRACLPPSSGCARSSTSRSSAADADEVPGASPSTGSGVAASLPSTSARRLAACALHASVRRLSRRARSSGCRSRPTSESATSSCSCAAAARGPRSRPLLVAPPGDDGLRPLARAGLLGPSHRSRRTASRSTRRRSRSSPSTTSPLPTARARTPRSAVGSHRSRAPGSRAARGDRQDSPASTPSFDIFDELRAALLLARARERRPDALAPPDALELATLGLGPGAGARRGDRLAHARQASRPRGDLPGGLAVPPWEDPATAVVFGGSPDRVLLTLVEGEDRYRKGREEAWHELSVAATRARGSLLGRGTTTART